MLSPEEDVADRSVIWDVMQDLYMDTDVTLSYECISNTCAASKYSMDDLEKFFLVPKLRLVMHRGLENRLNSALFCVL